MLTLTETAACEWSASGVRVNAVAPGGIVSSGFDTYTPEMQKKLHDFTAGVPLQRFGTEAEISAAIMYLLSPAAAYVTGPASGSMAVRRMRAPPGSSSRIIATRRLKAFIAPGFRRP